MERKIICKKLKDGYLSVRCGFCEGTGRFPETIENGLSDDPCPVCGGKGVNIFRNNKEELTKCRYCYGEGKKYQEGYFLGEECPICGGTGILPLEINSGEKHAFWGLINPKIQEISKSRFETGHYSDAVEAALKEINNILKKIHKTKTGNELDGSALMNAVFSVNNPTIILEELSTESGKNSQIGYMQIFSGAMTGIRNPKAHENITITPERAIHFLFLASLLMYKIEESITV